MSRFTCVRHLALFAAAVLSPAAAYAAPIVVTYNITGGSSIQPSMWGDIVSGTIVVTMPNPGSGPPPLNTNGHSVQMDFVLAYGTTFHETLTAAIFPTGMAFRGAGQTLTAQRKRFLSYGYYAHPPFRLTRFTMNANALGNIVFGTFLFDRFSASDTGEGWSGITGQEIVSVPDAGAAPLLALGGALLLGASALPTLRRARR
jgi:hypothetical protein